MRDDASVSSFNEVKSPIHCAGLFHTLMGFEIVCRIPFLDSSHVHTKFSSAPDQVRMFANSFGRTSNIPSKTIVLKLPKK